MRVTSTYLTEWINAWFKKMEMNFSVETIRPTRYRSQDYEMGAYKTIILCSKGFELYSSWSLSDMGKYISTDYELYIETRSRRTYDWTIELRKASNTKPKINSKNQENMQIKPKSSGRSDYWKPTFTQLIANLDFNLRDDYDPKEIAALADSIRANGVKLPLTGYRTGDKFSVTDGHRRYLAMELIYKQDKVDTECKFILEPGKYDNRKRTIDMMTFGSGGKRLTMMEQAKGVKRLIDDYKMSEKEVAKELGVSQAHINKVNKINKMKPETVELIRKGDISATSAIQIIVDKGEDEFLRKVEAGAFKEVIEKADEKRTRVQGSLLENANEEFQQYVGGGGEEAHPQRPATPAAPDKTAKIKPRDIKKKADDKEAAPAGPNSWKMVKDFINGFEGKPKDLDVQAAHTFLFLSKVIKNEVDEKAIARYFKVKAK